ncbi:peptidoglycan recognition protein [Streptomyces sp. WI04-05B]|uniref:peptidoglycan recognition protein family protein n=1 Tax=Streptomyces TaxID=1883 RepID=UPI0029B5B05C|nr:MULTISPECIES: peptidoglycan recognition protein [unclassified Streptomyces]MDX2540486.1 peptidoglycan recognition protein [Streptomyces sp. WI04-05B]MDX2585081.1 peptidoglycan recognition protein [Streptomyces sp. WI04-05A]
MSLLRSRRGWGIGAVVAAGVSGVLIVQGMSGGGADSAADDGKPVSGPIASEEYAAALKVAADGGSATLAKRDAKPFSMLGVTWSDPSAKMAGKVEVRTRDAGTDNWSSWLELGTDSGPGEEGATRAGTEPAWVGASDGVEVRVDGKASAELPKGLRVDMIDPGTSSVTDLEPAGYVAAASTESPDATISPEVSESPSPTATDSASASESPSTPPTVPPTESESPSSAPETTPPATTSAPATPTTAPPSTGPTAPPSTAVKPPITLRAGWGADESMSPEAPDYLTGGIKAVVVHHTAETNDYTCDQSPALIRGIYTYHVKTNGWKDIGYNFLVDKCGAIFEGRKGGVDKPVFGAHAYGFNSQTTGISVLGNYNLVEPPTAVLTSVARLAAWKLGQYGVDPAGTTTLTAGAAGTSQYNSRTWKTGDQLSFPTIHGHGDGYATECPGTKLYAQLPTIRGYAAGPVTGLALKSVTGAGVSGTRTYTKSATTVSWSATTPAALIEKFEVLVDGKVAATTAGTATSGAVNLALGTHSVAVRATHISGKATTTAAATVVAETTAPTFTTAPNLSLTTGTVNTTAVPVTLKWKATDSAALKEVRLTAPVAKTYGPTVTSANLTATSGAATTWSMTAYDQAGNTRAAAVAGTPVILQETSATRTGTWTAKSSTSYLGGKSFSSSAKNASMTWTFTGRSAALAVSRASTSGQVNVFVDNVKVATVDLKSATTKYRDAIWTKTWSASAKHTVKIVVVGTSGRPAVTTDGLVYLK